MSTPNPTTALAPAATDPCLAIPAEPPSGASPAPAERRWWSWMVAVVSAAAFSTAAPISAAIIDLGTNPTLILVVRLWLSALLLLATLALTAPGHLRLDRRAWWATAIAGLSNGAAVLLFFWALTRLDAGIASLLFSLSPLAVLALLALRGERLTRRSLARLVLGLGGVYLLVGGPGNGRPADWLGVGMVMAAVLLSSLQLTFTQWYLRPYNGLAVTLYMVAFMAVACTAWWLVTGAEWQAPVWQAWVGIGALVVVPTFLARLTMFAAIRRLGGGQVALLTPVETLLTLVWSVAFLGERLTEAQGVGSVLILLSAALAR